MDQLFHTHVSMWEIQRYLKILLIHSPAKAGAPFACLPKQQTASFPSGLETCKSLFPLPVAQRYA